jgi:hypothetical protein
MTFVEAEAELHFVLNQVKAQYTSNLFSKPQISDLMHMHFYRGADPSLKLELLIWRYY